MILHGVAELDKRSKKKRPAKGRSFRIARLRARLLLAGGSRKVGVFLLETLDAAGRVYEFLLAGEEWVAIGADFDAKHIALDGRTHLEGIPAGAMDGYRMIVGVDTGFHDSPFCRGRSARPPNRVGDYSRVARSQYKPQLYENSQKISNAAGKVSARKNSFRLRHETKDLNHSGYQEHPRAAARALARRRINVQERRL